MKIVIGQKDDTRRALIRKNILNLYPQTVIVECETWDCAVLDLIHAENTNFVFLDLDVLGISWFDRVVQLLSSLQNARLILMGQNIDIKQLIRCFKRGLIGYIPYHEMNGKLKTILSFILDFGTYIPAEIIPKEKREVWDGTEDKKYILPSGEHLTRRQIEVLTLLEEGLSNKQISAKLNITEPTVKLHIHGLFHKLGATNRTQIILKAQKLGFLHQTL